MTSLIHKGHSGFSVTFREDLNCVVKWTRGEESSKILRKSFELQEASNMEPIKPVKFNKISVGTENDVPTVLGFMPLIKEESGFTFTGNWPAFKFNILCSLVGRTMHGDHESFPRIINKNVQETWQYADSEMKKTFQKTIVKSGFYDRFWPRGFCHGDFGFANMLVDKYGNIEMIDYTPSFIRTPLVDVATMELSLFSDMANDNHRDILKSCRALFSDYKYHIDSIRMAKVLSYFRDNDTPERRSELTGMFYGIDRGANI